MSECSSPYASTALDNMMDFSQSTGSFSSASTFVSRLSVTNEEIKKLFKSPVANILSDKLKTATCLEELGDILEDCFRDDDDKDEGRPVDEFYKDGVLEGMVPKNKKTLRKYKNYQRDYLEYCDDKNLNPSGKANSQYTLCNYFHDR